MRLIKKKMERLRRYLDELDGNAAIFKTNGTMYIQTTFFSAVIRVMREILDGGEDIAHGKPPLIGVRIPNHDLGKVYYPSVSMDDIIRAHEETRIKMEEKEFMANVRHFSYVWKGERELVTWALQSELARSMNRTYAEIHDIAVRCERLGLIRISMSLGMEMYQPVNKE